MVDEQGPSLEPPTLFGGRRKKKESTPDQVVPAPESPTTILDDVPAAASTRIIPPLASGSPLTPPPAPTDGTKSPRRLRAREFEVDGRLASAIAGVVVGFGMVGATAASFNLCEAVRGTNSCGGPGVFLLIAILIGAIAVGAGILTASRVPGALSTSVLAVGLVSVVALLFLVEALFSPWMLVVIPLVSAGAFVGSHWIATNVDEDSTSESPAEPVSG
jgi:hypothetical protein